MRLTKVYLIFFILSSFSQLTAQDNIPVGTWRTHLSYNNVIAVALGENQIYGATSNAIFVYNKVDFSIRTITKLDGLSGGEISAIAYSEQENALIIGYKDGNLDIIKENIISSITTIKTDNFTTEKRINNIYIKEGLAYLAGDFGISIIDLQKVTITETIVNLGPDKINEVAILGDSLFAATSDGILAASLDPSINILDFNNWKSFSEPSGEIISITNSNNQLYIAESQGSLYEYVLGIWEEQAVLQGDSFVKISPSLQGLLIITEDRIWRFTDDTLTSIDDNLVTKVSSILEDEENIIWIADQTNGLIKHITPNATESIIPSGPFSDNSFHTAYIQNKIYVLSGGISDNDTPFDRNVGFYQFDNGLWENFNEAGVGTIIPQAKDLNDITFNPKTNQLAIASFQDGILLVNDDNTTEVVGQLTPGSSLLSDEIPGVVYANDGIWILNYGQDKSVHHWGDDGLWQSFTLNNTATKYPLDIIVAENNDKWMRLSPSFGGGLFVFNEETGKQRLLNNVANNGGLPASDVYAVAEDLDGLIWVGTSRGVAYFSSSRNIDTNNAVDAITPRVDLVPLLRDEKITVITVDAGNRKWIGTENGVWLFDETGEREINHFNINNSPLLSNAILSISIDSNNGEVFFATDQGLVSYRGTATASVETHQSVKIFPNPITRDFNGLVAISGLANNAIVKITDIAGKLIRQMTANGGTATWNVADYNGNRAATGVYLVFSATEDGEDTFEGKLAVVN